MGCVITKETEGQIKITETKKRKTKANEVAVFVPGLRIPKECSFQKLLEDCSSTCLGVASRLSTLRTNIVKMASQRLLNSKRKMLLDLQQALEEYLPVLLGLAKEEDQSRKLVEFSWYNQEDFENVTTISNSWYEVLSVLHMMAMISFSQANSFLIQKASNGGHRRLVSEEDKKEAINMFLKAAGYLDYAACNVLPRLSHEEKMKLPTDLQEGVLEAISLQALGQCVEIQLGLAIDSRKATLAVKRRLACEQVKYWCQAQCCISNTKLTTGLGPKHFLFLQWKQAEAKAAAYYYHGLTLAQGNDKDNRKTSMTCLCAAEQLLRQSKKACINFCLAAPVTRIPPAGGPMKHLSQKIAMDAHNRGGIFQQALIIEEDLPDLPDFPVALKPDEYELPPIDPSWAVKFPTFTLNLPPCKDGPKISIINTLKLQDIEDSLWFEQNAIAWTSEGGEEGMKDHLQSKFERNFF